MKLRKLIPIFLIGVSITVFSVAVNALGSRNLTIDSPQDITEQSVVGFPIVLSKEDSAKVRRHVFLGDEPQDTMQSVVADDTVSMPFDAAFMVTPDSIMWENDSVVLKAAIVLSDIYGKKEMEFTKGFLSGISKAGLPPRSLSLKLLNGEIPSDSLVMCLTEYDPDVIFLTQDKECPPSILGYAGEHSTRVVNVFEARGEEYLQAPSLIQLLIPSPKFNISSAKWLNNRFNDSELLIIGDAEQNDALIREICFAWPGSSQTAIKLPDLGTYNFKEKRKYVLYAAPSKSADVMDVVKSIKTILDKNPQLDITVIGRPSWINLVDLKKNLATLDVYIPAKCYFDPSEPQSRKFMAEYKDKYGTPPIRSYPVYAVMGYDVASYFLPQLLGEKISSSSLEWPREETLQLNMAIDSDSWFSGQYNSGSYILHFEPDGTQTKLPIKTH